MLPNKKIAQVYRVVNGRVSMTQEPELFPGSDITYFYYSNFGPGYTPFLSLHPSLLALCKHFAHLFKEYLLSAYNVQKHCFRSWGYNSE